MSFFSDKKKVAWLSVASNTLLTGGKITAGIMTGSVSILSEGAHSAMDLLAAIIATISVHTSDRPPDEDHQYGHEKIENVSGVIEGILIFVAAAWIIWESLHKLIYGVELKFLGPGIAIMAVSAILNTLVATALKRAAKKTRSVALEADATHLYTDVLTSLGVMIGLAVITIGDRFFDIKLLWLDPVIAMGVALLIIHAAYEITAKSFSPLMDVAASPEEETAINVLLEEFHQKGTDFHKLRTRKAGGSLYVDLHMGCRPGVTLEQGHEVSHELKARIEGTIPGAKVLIHVEPSSQIHMLAATDEKVKCMNNELMKDKRVREVRNLKVASYKGEFRVEADLGLEPAVTVAEMQTVSRDLEARLTGCFREVKELSLTLHPADGWQDAIHDDDKQHISQIVGEHESSFAGIHELQVISSGGRHRVNLHVGLPRSLPLSVAHLVGKHLEEDIQRIFPEGVEVDLHVEPCHQTCESCRAACPEKDILRPDAETRRGESH